MAHCRYVTSEELMVQSIIRLATGVTYAKSTYCLYGVNVI
jgi:hypothetical protein